MDCGAGDGSAGAWEGRVEDESLIRGNGQFADDFRRPGSAVAVFLRSPHAHAAITRLDCQAARTAPGVIAVLTAVDMEGLASSTRSPPLMAGKSTAPLRTPFRPTLAKDRVRHVGEAVAMVVAETASAAADAVDLIEAEYDPLPSVADAREALAPGAPVLFDDIPGNLAVDWTMVADPIREAAVDRILRTAPKIVRRRFLNQRIAGVTLEPRGVTATYDPASGRYTYRGPSQGTGTLAGGLAGVLGVSPDKMRVLSDDVGGAFGLKTPPYPEYAALLVAAKKLGRPVRWNSTRAEAFLSDNQARDNSSEATLALDESGRFLALKVEAVVNLGGYSSSAGPNIATGGFAGCFPGMYAIPEVSVSVKLTYTNTVPTGPYRGAGRPESNYVMERLVDAAARALGIDRVELRRRNLIPPAAMPYTSAIGKVYDSGDFAAILDKALKASDFSGAAVRKRASAAAGKLRGFGVSCFLEHSGGSPESAVLLFEGDMLTVRLGVQASGQGHATAFRNLVADRLGLPRRNVRLVEGDSDFGIKGGPAVGSRTAMTAGPAMAKAVDLAVEKGRKVAAQILEASENDITYQSGFFTVAGTDRRTGLFEVAAKAAGMARDGAIPESLDTTAIAGGAQTFPNGCHIAEIEIDPETGNTEILAYTAVDDCGTVLDHTIAEGQVVGGIAQGVGQALLEMVRYDADGQMLSGSLMDYGMPRADTLPSIESAFHSVPATSNSLGIKGVGEAGSTAAIAAIMNAIADAIPNGRGEAMDMPATPDKIWAACRG